MMKHSVDIKIKKIFQQLFKAGGQIMKQGFIPVRGGKVWFRVVGFDKKAIPLLVLHGGPGMPHFYLESLEPLAAERPVIFYDQLGCGNSITTEKETHSLWTLERFVGEIQIVLDALGIEKVHILGHSWGAMLAVEYFASKANPDGVMSLILSGPFLSTPKWNADAKMLLKTLPEDIQKIVEEAEINGDYENTKYEKAMKVFYENFFCRMDPWPASLLKSFEAIGLEVHNDIWGPSKLKSIGKLRDYESIGKLESVTSPVLIITGEFDETPPETAEYYRSLVSGADLYIVKDASHCHHLEKPEEFNSVVSQFIKKFDK